VRVARRNGLVYTTGSLPSSQWAITFEHW
jgi:hypothetical protein